MSGASVLPIAEQYCSDVLAGRILAPRYVKRACRRHRLDLRNGAARGLHFDPAAAERVLKFSGVVKHSKGKWANTPVVLEPWEQFIIWVLFGWMRADGTRRFRTAYISVARKNGKSTLAAIIGLYMAFVDREPGADVFAAATKKDQAKIIWSEASRMVRSSPMLRKYIKVGVNNLVRHDTNSKFEPLGADSDTLDGLNVAAALIDEIHKHKTRDLWDVLETATSARAQPLLFGITTAGFNRQSLCFQLEDYGRKILDNIWDDDSYFCVVYGLDKGDDWKDESLWIKANPNLGVSKNLSDMRDKAHKAREMPTALNAFLRLELNVWTASETKWLDIDAWGACDFVVDPEELAGRPCYAGLDLSSTVDITAWVLVFPPQRPGEKYKILPRFWVPADNLLERVRKDRVHYDVWERAGLIVATPGDAIDYDWIFEQVQNDAEKYKIEEIAFDRWGAARVVQVLQSMGLKCFDFGQGYQSMSPPMKDLERMIAKRQIAHDGNPVLAWMADNLVAVQDPTGGIKPDKARSREKIDGMVALIMALDRALRNGPGRASVYTKRGIVTA